MTAFSCRLLAREAQAKKERKWVDDGRRAETVAAAGDSGD